ncbi:hypothetical protein B0H11DRAFT_2191718 [Mycena galericulata]|nr:hypothetical protein B0H11DRAFT_2191718 [Mycena galericulata]
MFGSRSSDDLRDRTEIKDLQAISGARRLSGDRRNILNIPAIYGARRWPEYLTEIIDFRSISGPSAGPGDHSLPPVSPGRGAHIGEGHPFDSEATKSATLSKCKRREDPMQPTVQLHPSRLQNHGGSEQTGKPVSSACDSAASSEHAMKVAWKGQGRNGGTNTTGKPDRFVPTTGQDETVPNVSTNVRLRWNILRIFEGISVTMSWRVSRVVRGRCQLSRSWLTRAGACLVYPDTPNAWIAVRDSEEYRRERPKVEV